MFRFLYCMDREILMVCTVAHYTSPCLVILDNGLPKWNDFQTLWSSSNEYVCHMHFMVLEKSGFIPNFTYLTETQILNWKNRTDKQSLTSRNLKSGWSVKQMPSWVNKDRITRENLSGIRMGYWYTSWLNFPSALKTHINWISVTILW